MPVQKEIDLPSIYKNEFLYVWFGAMHTRIDLLLSGNEEKQLKEVASQIASEITRLEKVGSYFDPESELSQLNRAAYGKPVNISRDLFQMLTLCKTYYEITGNLFDISIRSDKHHPQTLESLILERSNPSVRFDEKGILLDLSGFLKGFALDKIRGILEVHSVSNALINLGNSSILGLGNHPNGEGWKIQLASPEAESKSYILHNECYTTSGNETSGRKHILNPRTGTWLEGKKTVSVITRSGSLGEALSTAFSLIEGEEQEQILSRIQEQYPAEFIAILH
jgi:Membrane-associated lipoprotein involved in thiamine biosynthesis